MSPKRILIFSLAYYPVEGGAEIAVKEITDRISDFEFDMVTMRFDDNHLSKEKIGNCTIYRINTSKNLYIFKALFLARKLHADRPYNAIWAIMANWAGFAALFFKFNFPQVPFVLTLQEGDPIPYIKRKVWFVYPLFRKIFLKADVIQAISTYLADWAKDMGYTGKSYLIPNGVNVKKFQTVKSRAFDKDNMILITTSRLVKKNSVGDIIEALKFLPESVRLEILGIGPLEKVLKLQVESLKLKSRVQFLGHVEHYDISKYLLEADIFIRPSLSEGQGISFIEAMAAGLPIIATSVGGIPDFLKDGETGLFCEVKNPESIAKQVRRLMADSDLRRVIVENAKKMVEEKYDWDLIAREMKSKIFDPISPS